MNRLIACSKSFCVVVLFLFAWKPMSATGQCGCPADLTVDAKRDGADLPAFLDCLLNGTAGKPGCDCADMNADTQVDQIDIQLFVSAMLSGGTCTIPAAGLEPGSLETPRAIPGPSAKQCATPLDRDAGTGIYLFSGEAHYEMVDMQIKGRGVDFVWGRKYRSRFGPNTAMGNGWDFSYNIYIETSGPDRILHDGNSRTDTYTLQSNGKWGRNEFFRELQQEVDGTYSVIFADKGKLRFRSLTNPIAPGRISSVEDRNGNSISFDYDGAGRLDVITDTLGRSVTLSYNPDGLLAVITDFTGREVMYSYYQNGDAGGSAGDLKSVRSPIVTGTPNGNDFPAGKTTTYTYTKGYPDPARNHNLLTVTDPKGQTYLGYSYSNESNPAGLTYDRAVRQIWGNSGDIIDWTIMGFSTVGPYRMIITANDRVGSVKEYSYDAGNRLVRKREFTGRAPDADAPTTALANRPTGKLRVTDPDYFETAFEYNEDSLITRTVSPNGNETQNVYELALNPNAARRERGNLRQRSRLPGPLGGDQAAITELYTYETGFGGCGCGTNFVKTHTDGRGNTTTHTYDAFGNRTHTDHRPGGGVEDWTYNAFGQMTSHTLPANGSAHRRLDTRSYYAAGPQMGYLQTDVIDSGGFNLTSQYEYDGRGNMVRRVDPNGADTLYTYNALDQAIRTLSREVTPGIRYESLSWFDADDYLVRSDTENRDDNGILLPNTHFSMIYQRDILNRVIRTCQEKSSAGLTISDLTCADFPAGTAVTTEFEYDANGNQTRIRMPEAVNGSQPTNTVDTEYDERDMVFRVIRAKTDPAQSTDQSDYDGNGGLTKITQGLENAPRITQLQNDGYGRRISTVDAMGNVSTSHFDANGNTILQRIDGEHIDIPGSALNDLLWEATYQIDAMDRMTQRDIAHFDTQTQAPIGDGFSTTQWTYADNSQVLTETNDNSHATTTTYDTANRLSVVTDAKLNTVVYTYDLNSNFTITTETDLSDLGNPAQVFVTTMTYDGLDRRISTADNIGNVRTFAYDSRGNCVRTIDARGNHTRFEFDTLNWLTLTSRDMNGNQLFTDPDDIVTTQSWDNDGRLTSQTDDNGNATMYAYDALNRKTGTTFADCSMESRGFDVHHNPISMTDANGTVVASTYDLNNRLTGKIITPGAGVSSDTTFEIYAYDGLSQCVRAEDNDSLVMRSRDSLSRVTSETLNNETTASVYDGVGNMAQCTYPGGRVIDRTFDTLERIDAISEVGFGNIASYDYIGPGRVERRDYLNGTRCDYTYDGIAPNPPGDFGVRNIVRTRHTRYSNGSVLDDRTYLWDRDANKKQRRDMRLTGPQYRHNYTYDAADRLTRTVVLDPANQTLRDETYTMDGVGNRTAVTGGNDPGPYVMVGDMCAASGDQDMNQYTSTAFDVREYDPDGNLTVIDNTMPAQRNLVYDFRNRMVEHTDMATGTVSRYKYDCLGRRIEKVVDVTGTPATTRYFYDGWRVAEEQDGTGATTATYVHGNYIDDVVTMRRSGDNFYYHNDDLYNVMAITNGAGAVVGRTEYGDYGQPLDPTTLAPVANITIIGSPTGSKGMYYDPETKLYNFRSRYVDPIAGRFATRDSIEIWGDASNLGNGASFVGNNPWSATDPTGRVAPTITAAAAMSAAPAPPPGNISAGNAINDTLFFDRSLCDLLPFHPNCQVLDWDDLFDPKLREIIERGMPEYLGPFNGENPMGVRYSVSPRDVSIGTATSGGFTTGPAFSWGWAPLPCDGRDGDNCMGTKYCWARFLNDKPVYISDTCGPCDESNEIGVGCD